MPTYDYVCDGCQHEFEAFESITAPAQTDCPTCGETKLRRKIGPGAAILFKGSGFYITDYRSDNYKSSAKADQPSSSSSTSNSNSPATSSTSPSASNSNSSSASASGSGSGGGGKSSSSSPSSSSSTS